MKKRILLFATVLASSFVGKAQNPQLIANINEGVGSSSPRGMTEYKGKLYFSATSVDDGFEFYEYDGTEIIQIDDIRPGKNSSAPEYFKVFNDTLYFSANDGQSGVELFRYDGVNDPEVAVDLANGTASSFPRELTIFDDKLYFASSGAVSAFSTSGEAVESIWTGTSFPSDFTVLDGKLYFIANEPVNNMRAIWQYDGTNTPTILTGTEGVPSNLVVFKDRLFFAFKENDQDGTELFSYDSSMVSLEAIINTAPLNGSFPTELTVFNGDLYFRATTSAEGYELYKYDGIQATLITDLNPGTQSSTPFGFEVFNNKLYFSADGGTSGTELYVYDGSSISLVNDLYPGSFDSAPSFLVVFDNELYFSATSNLYGTELFSYDGSGTPTIIQDLASDDLPSDPNGMIEFDGAIYFSATDGINGVELWKHDGTQTVLFANIGKASISSSPGGFVVFKDSLFFTTVRGMYRTDGITAPVKVEAITVGSIEEPTVVGNKLYFGANDGISGQELWVYDGTSSSLVADLTAGSPNTTPRNLRNVNGVLTFTNTFTDKIWSYNGTNPPVELIESSFQPYEDPRNFTVFNNNLYFTAETDVTLSFGGMTQTQKHRQLFRSNGVNTPDVVSALEYTVGVRELGIYNNRLVFSAEEIELPNFVPYFFSYAGGNSADRIDLNGLSQAGLYTEVNDTLYFRAGNGAASLWRYVTGGKPEFVSVIPGGGINRLEGLTEFNGSLLFSADNVINGRELWGIGGMLTGLNDFFHFSEKSELKLYPNPASSFIHTEVGHLEIFGLAGNRVMTVESEGRIDVSQLDAGIYIVLKDGESTKLVID